MAIKDRIGVLTGGGDVPGLNSVIKSVVYRATEMQREVIGIRRGWEGLTHLDASLDFDPVYLRHLTRENTRTIDRSGGTTLHTSRTNPERLRRAGDSSTVDLTPVVLANLKRLGIGCLIVIGGDDTLSFAATLHRQGMPLIAIPKTMDNDVRGTEYCIGFSTAITRAKDAITRQRTTLGSHERIGIFRIFGRNSGFTALYSGYVTSSRCLIPEHPFDVEHLCRLLMEDKRNNPSNYSLVVVSEGAVWAGQQVAEYGESDAYGHRKKVDIGHALAEEIKRRTGLPTRMQDITYDLRSGEPDAFDKIVASSFGALAVQMIASGRTDRMVCLAGGVYADAPLPDAKLGARTVDVGLFYDTATFRPKRTAHAGRPVFF